MSPTPATQAPNTRIEVFDSLGSTNDEAMARAVTGADSPLWIVAREQKTGRGRQGRVWVSPPGNLHASLLLVDPCATPLSPQLGFVAGVALHTAVTTAAALTPGRLALKWPNDLLLDGAKLAGILVEGTRLPDGRFAVVIGCGVNLRHFPPGTPYAATSLHDAGVSVTPDTLIAVLSGCMDDTLALWRAGENFAGVRSAWLARAGGLGGPITVRRPDGDRHGIFVDLDPDGRLLLDQPSGRIRIEAGDVFLGTPPDPVSALMGPAHS